MKISYRSKLVWNPVQGGHMNTVVGDVYDLEIDGIPYAPPAPEPVRRWECNVTLIGTDTDFCYPSMHGERGGHKHERAHVHVGFDAQGRVWFADKDAQQIAAQLREWASNPKYGHMPLLLGDAARRLAGPEPDAT